MIYTTNDKPDSFPKRAELRGLTAAANWIDGRDPQEIRYVARLDWTCEHLPPSILPFLPGEAMTTEEANEFFAAFTGECRVALAA
jgi:hypothetical protein